MSPPLRTARILVTAGAEKQALAAVRSLGRGGFAVDVTNTRANTPAFSSRYCSESLLAPSNHDREAYVEFLLERVRRVETASILACDDLTAGYLSAHRDDFKPWTRLALPPADVYATATDKGALMAWAEQAGMPVPRSLHATKLAEVDAMAATLGFPLILKGAHGWGAQHVRLVRHADELMEKAREIAGLEGGRVPMLQQFVSGIGYGFSTLFRHGEPRAIFMHRRAAEFDVQSHVMPYSCPLAESIEDPELRRLGVQLFQALGWHGLGMAEWRRDSDTGRFYLMEINPRLAGSTDLAIRSGVDLPLLAMRMLLHDDIEPVLEFRSGVRLRWLLPDGLRDLLARPEQLLLPRVRRTHSDWSWRDFRPHWMQLRLAAWELRHSGRRP